MSELFDFDKKNCIAIKQKKKKGNIKVDVFKFV